LRGQMASSKNGGEKKPGQKSVGLPQSEKEKEQLQSDMRAQRDLCEAIVANAPVGIAVFGRKDLRVRWANEIYRRELDHPDQHPTLQGLHLTEILPKESAGLPDLFRQAAATGQIHSEPEFRMIGSGRGETFWHLVIIPLPDREPGGEILLIAQDITTLTQARNHTEQQKARIQAILDHSPAVIYLKDRPGRILVANKAAARIFGRSVESIIGKTDHELFPRDFADLVRHNDELVLAAGEHQEFEENIELEDGPHTFISIKSPLRDEAGKIIGICGISTDITSRKQAEAERHQLLEQLRAKTAELEATFAAMTEAVVIFGPEGEILRMNPAAEDFLDYPKDMLEKPLHERLAWVQPTDLEGRPLEPEKMPVARALRGEDVQGMIVVLHPPGRTIWAVISAAPVCTPEGRQLGAVATLTDVTPLHDLQESRELYIHTISHDLRTPLTVIQGHSQMLEESLSAGKELPEDTEMHIEAILTGTDRMNAMIEDMVEAARLEGDELRLEKETILLPVILENLLQSLSPGMDTDRLHVEIPRDLPPVRADRNRLERILANLLSNALKYGPPSTPIHFRVTPGTGEVVLSLADRGPGIDPDDLPYIFERFYKPKAGRKGGGVGLGLYIARRLVEAHGGRIWAESTPGEGSTFYFTLPTTQ
jgi:PAS domain S-box-containing protein